MITHGNKQISEIVYARKHSDGGGAVRLTNIIRGAQVVFGRLGPSFGWLKDTTTVAILAAFGQTDGKAVIKATNAYLNALAETDQNKAATLAGFINEDPMLVCSFVETGKTRFIVGDGVYSYIDSGVDLYYTNKYTISIDIIKSLNASAVICGVYQHIGDDISSLRIDEFADGIKVLARSPQSYITINSMSNGSQYSILVDTSSGIYIDGNNVYANKLSINYANGIDFYAYGSRWINQGASFRSSNSKLVKFIMYENDIMLREMYPFIRNGENGMLDTITGTFYPNVNTSGSVTIGYTLPDGTPWAPLNQTK